LGDQQEEASRRIAELESLCKQNEEAIAKLKQENASLELGIQSRNELIEEMAAEMGLDRMGEDYDDDENGATEDTAAAAPAAAAPKVAVKEEDPEMLILEWESPEALEIILLDKEPKPLQPRLFTVLLRDHEESPLRIHDDLDDLTLDDYDEEQWYPDADD
jgi:hypothetical protein